MGGSVVSYIPPLATKGDLINMDLDGNGNKTYRVLAISGNVAKLLGMSDISTSQKYNATSKTGTFTNSTTGQLYVGSDLDTYLNTTWYNTLCSAAKAAIVPESRTQYMYQYYPFHLHLVFPSEYKVMKIYQAENIHVVVHHQ